ncbi:hypothetical protein L13192_07565 [Pyrenophora tritici-repentis]|uniref:Uncharacterized protein n=1 Tax=Pyrenophora tritici-repentis (strain Pt-1C-BFP) TaxID=426418 RepID=B2W5E4_PYRTR|nr:uncharacterized protein PTRG_04844 [Pyrenophora tritici-repentis Pt-1C-BFP]EDU47751.1 predicted protein [Pyrenophora tritici-repentis Pt-1C-BFP]KAI1668429.1 hypothetical protein L13192_07565 [Pyrenophora tritici-repentis]
MRKRLGPPTSDSISISKLNLSLHVELKPEGPNHGTSQTMPSPKARPARKHQRPVFDQETQLTKICTAIAAKRHANPKWQLSVPTKHAQPDGDTASLLTVDAGDEPIVTHEQTSVSDNCSKTNVSQGKDTTHIRHEALVQVEQQTRPVEKLSSLQLHPLYRSHTRSDNNKELSPSMHEEEYGYDAVDGT